MADQLSAAAAEHRRRYPNCPICKPIADALQDTEAQLAEIRSNWAFGDHLIHRNEQLERVREAAAEIINWSTALYVETHDREYWTAIRLADAERLRTALKMLRLTENATAHKAG